MNNITTILLVLLIACFLAMAVWLFLPREADKGVSIHVDDKSGVRIIQNPDGIRLDIIYATQDEKPANYALFPDIVNDIPSPVGVNRDFWLEVASVDDPSFPADRREEILSRLSSYGFIRKGQSLEARDYSPEEDRDGIVSEQEISGEGPAAPDDSRDLEAEYYSDLESFMV